MKLDVACPPACGVDVIGKRAHLGRGIQPVGIDANGQHRRLDTRESGSIGAAPWAFGSIIAVHRAGEIEVTVGIEASHQLLTLMLKVRFNVQAWPKHRPIAIPGSDVSPEARLQSGSRGVGEYAKHTRNTQASRRPRARRVVPVLPGWIAHNGLARDGVNCQALR